ncbi:hypothetical protein V5O48_018905 [Marasmius crinis-equi]|uniref:BZIP domain-containing protein n=1 Tax=Marasmius crinis-equi TaxID=585013 RepID=A0ABR3EJZ4_9AGAR
MPSSHLQGLNVVHPPQPEVDSQDLLTGTHFPDIAAQLALWTNLPFESEEGNVFSHEDKFGKGSPTEEDEEEKRGPAPHDSHVNVVTGTNVGTTEQPQFSIPQRPPTSQQSGSFDLNALISGFGLNFQQQQQNHHAQTPSLAQLLALHSMTQNPTLYQPQSHQPAASQQPIQHATQRTSPTSDSASSGRSSSGNNDMSPPPAKRARARKASVSTADSPTDSVDSSTVAVAAAEDKRRRNTAASARFRLKKKEREFALETKAKELETRVNELERECEGLRRENGWLKGLVVGVTGAAQSSANPQPPVLAGIRRSREDD